MRGAGVLLSLTLLLAAQPACSSEERKDMGRGALVAVSAGVGSLLSPLGAMGLGGIAHFLVMGWEAQDDADDAAKRQKAAEDRLAELVSTLIQKGTAAARQEALDELAKKAKGWKEAAFPWLFGAVGLFALWKGWWWFLRRRKEGALDGRLDRLEKLLQRDLDGDGQVGR